MKISEFRKIVDKIDNQAKEYGIDRDVTIALLSTSYGKSSSNFSDVSSIEAGFGLTGFEITIFAEDYLTKFKDKNK